MSFHYERLSNDRLRTSRLHLPIDCRTVSHPGFIRQLMEWHGNVYFICLTSASQNCNHSQVCKIMILCSYIQVCLLSQIHFETTTNHMYFVCKQTTIEYMKTICILRGHFLVKN